jgi:hypothetical protein
MSTPGTMVSPRPSLLLRACVRVLQAILVMLWTILIVTDCDITTLRRDIRRARWSVREFGRRAMGDSQAVRWVVALAACMLCMIGGLAMLMLAGGHWLTLLPAGAILCVVLCFAGFAALNKWGLRPQDPSDALPMVWDEEPPTLPEPARSYGIVLFCALLVFMAMQVPMGLLFVAMGLVGAVLVFRRDLRESLSPPAATERTTAHRSFHLYRD